MLESHSRARKTQILA